MTPRAPTTASAFLLLLALSGNAIAGSQEAWELLATMAEEGCVMLLEHPAPLTSWFEDDKLIEPMRLSSGHGPLGQRGGPLYPRYDMLPIRTDFVEALVRSAEPL